MVPFDPMDPMDYYLWEEVFGSSAEFVGKIGKKNKEEAD